MLAIGVLGEICRYGEYEKLYEKIATDDCEQQHVVNGFIRRCSGYYLRENKLN